MKMVKEIEKILFEGLFSKQIFLFSTLNYHLNLWNSIFL